jgi:prolyl-tRNA synthetase
MITGANKKDYHIKNVSVPRDVRYDMAADITNIKEGDSCPKCGGKIVFKKGIEVGNTFKLGTKYSQALDLEYADKNNTLHPVVMGSYGIGLCRSMAAVVEQNADESGIVWPMNIAPYKVYIVLIRANDEAQAQAAEKLYSELTSTGIDCILDDRDERAGVKFNDADLIGIPLRVTVGRGITDGIVELKERKSGEVVEVSIDDVVEKITDLVNNA